MGYDWDFGLLAANYQVVLRGILVTLELWFPSFLLGMAGGLLVAAARLSGRAVPSRLGRAYVELFRDVPVLIQLIWFYYALPVVVGVQLQPFAAAVLALSLNTSAYCAEIFRGGIQSVARGQFEGAKALGMTRAAMMRRVVLPQVGRRMLPAFTNRAIELAKVTSLASVLSVHELMYQGRLLSATYYRPLEVLTAVAAVYFVLIYPGAYLSARLERRLARYG